MIEDRIKFLQTIQSNFKVAELNQERKKPSAWIDLKDYKKSYSQIRFREQLKKEFILELDGKTEAINIKAFEDVLKPIFEKNNVAYEAWQTHSKSLHINLFFDKEIDNNDRYSWLCEQLGEEHVKQAIEKGLFDKAYFTKDSQLIAMEYQPHYKSGKEKNLYAFSIEKINNFKINKKIIYQEPTERKVKLTYGEILKNKTAGEQERVSCIMQIYNKHQTWTAPEIFDYVAKHNQWKNYDPEITRQKIEDFIIPKYKDKQNPLEKILSLDDVPTLDLINFDEYNKVFADTHKHLPSFDLIDSELGLEGKEYYPIKKVMVYRIESLRQKTISINVGKEWTDNRLHVLFFGGAGTGKGILKSAIRLHNKAVECSGARTNLDQLIGKIDKKQNEIEGYFRQDALDVDECHTLIIEEDRNLAGIMREFRIAMDTFGRNTVDKKNVDAERFLSYNPETRFGFYSHDTILPPVFFDLGTARRLFAFELKPVLVDEDSAIKSLLMENKTQELKDYINNKNWNARTNGFSKEGVLELIKWIKAWNKFCLLNTNQRIRILGKRMFFSGKQYFMRLCVILSVARNEPAVTDVTVKQACFDCFQFLLKTIEIYGNKSILTLSRDIWKTSDMNESMLFEWLHYKGALSKDKTEVSIAEVQNQIQDIFGVTSERQAKSIYKKLKKNGFIHDYKGQHDSKAWLGFIPNLEELVHFEDNTPLDLMAFLEKEKKELSEVTEVNSWGGLSTSVQPNISSSFSIITPKNYDNLSKNNVNGTPAPITSNTSQPKWELIDGDLPVVGCVVCRDIKHCVAKKPSGTGIDQYVCEMCYEEVAPQ